MQRLMDHALAVVLTLIVGVLIGGAGVSRAAAAPARQHDFVLRWTFATGAAVRQAPVVAGDLVYVASQDGNLYALALESGEEAWRQPTGSGFPLQPTVSDGVVYVANQAGALHAFDAVSGEPRWRVDGVSSLGNGGPVAAGETVFINQSNADGAVLYALDLASGAERWRAALGRSTFGLPAVLAETVYVTVIAAGGDRPTVVAFDARTGQTRAEFRPSTSMLLQAAAGDLLYGVGPDGLQALDGTTGAERWHFRPAAEEAGTWGVDGPAVAGGVLYVGTGIGQGGAPGAAPADTPLYALDAATGELVWATEIGGGVAYGPAVAGDTVYVIAGLSGLYAPNATSGEVTWYNPRRATVAASLGAANGTILLGDQDGTVTAFVELAW